MSKLNGMLKLIQSKGAIMPLPPQSDPGRLAEQFNPAIIEAVSKITETRKIEADKEVRLKAIKEQAELYHKILNEKCKTIQIELERNIAKKEEIIDNIISKIKEADDDGAIKFIDKAIDVLKTPCISEETISSIEKINFKI